MLKTKNTFLLLLTFFTLGCSSQIRRMINSGSTTTKEFKTVIPFETRLGLIVLKAELNGKTYSFIFDTGAMTSIISPEMKKALNAKVLMSKKVYDVDNNYKIQDFVNVQEIKIGDNPFHDITATIMDLRNIPTIKCLDVDGLIGSNLLRHATWSIDFEKKEITIANKVTNLGKSVGDYKAIKFHEGFGGVPSITTYLNGQKVLNNLIDFGFGGEVSLNENLAKKINTPLHKGYGVSSVGIYGQENIQNSFKGKVDNYSLGNGIDLKNQSIIFSGKDHNSIGSGVFKYYHILLDWNKNKMYFKRNSLPYKGKKEFGYSLSYKEGNVFIRQIYENTEAQIKGLKINDQVISMNGESMVDIDENTWCSILSTRDESDTRTLVIERDGQQKEILLEHVIFE